MSSPTTDRRTALITGASSGIGLELARIFAREGFDLALVARNEKRLAELAAALQAQYGAKAAVIAQDLNAPGAAEAVFAAVERAGLHVDALVNSAGFASYGPFWETDAGQELEMMQVNMVALTHLTKLFVPGMRARGYGKILNIASTAAFQPGPLMAVYYATKAYVLSFSQALAVELADSGIVVSALCPGPTASGFQKRADMERSKLVQSGLMDARAVAEMGYRGLMRGHSIVVPGLRNQLLTLSTRLVPRSAAARIAMRLQASI